MLEVRFTHECRRWLDTLRDQRARLRIIQRLARAEAGLLGDVKFFDGIGEFRVDHGPGYRLYFVQRGQTLIILLCGGDKSTQSKDIKRAIRLAKEA